MVVCKKKIISIKIYLNKKSDHGHKFGIISYTRIKFGNCLFV